MGRSLYERMRRAMAPDLLIDPWDALSEATRESFRSRMDYLVPGLLTVCAGGQR